MHIPNTCLISGLHSLDYKIPKTFVSRKVSSTSQTLVFQRTAYGAIQQALLLLPRKRNHTDVITEMDNFPTGHLRLPENPIIGRECDQFGLCGMSCFPFKKKNIEARSPGIHQSSDVNVCFRTRGKSESFRQRNEKQVHCIGFRGYELVQRVV